MTQWHLAAGAVLACLGVWVTWEAWFGGGGAGMFSIATHDEEYSHILLVPPIALWLAYVRRMRFRRCRRVGTGVGPVMVAVGWLASWYGFNHGVQVAWQGGALLVALGCALSVLGRHVLFSFLPVFAVLAFMVPVPGTIRQQIALPLQAWIARITQLMLGVFGVETEVSGNMLFCNGQAVTIQEACNGMRMVFPLILITYAFAFGLPLRGGVRVALLLLSPVVAILANVLRTLPTVWLYGYQERRWADLFHDYSGWLMLPLAFLVLLGVIRLLRWAAVPVQRYTLAGG